MRTDLDAEEIDKCWVKNHCTLPIIEKLFANKNITNMKMAFSWSLLHRKLTVLRECILSILSERIIYAIIKSVKK